LFYFCKIISSVAGRERGVFIQILLGTLTMLPLFNARNPDEEILSESGIRKRNISKNLSEKPIILAKLQRIPDS